MAKVFKLSLATVFSKYTMQEMPEGHEQAKDILPRHVFKWLEKGRRSYDLPLILPFLQDLLQCKGLAAPIPDEMILDAYCDHAKILSSVGESPQLLLDQFRLICQEFGKSFNRHLRKETSFASKSAYLGFPRSKGGLEKALSESLRTKGFIPRCSDRIDPIVLHLEGSPGIGKSRLTQMVAQRVSKRFGFLKPSLYSRSVVSDHWDGYNHQLISSIDDFGNCRERQPQDYSALIQICSELPFVLPMADLREKGREFKSEFVFLSTNGLTSNDGMYAVGQQVACTEALLRRVSPTFRISQLKFDHYLMEKFELVEKRWVKISGVEANSNKLADLLELDLIGRYNARYGKYYQPIVSNLGFEVGSGYFFDLKPPHRLPMCEAHAIPEPLKVRMITKNEPSTWILKPVQRALWMALGDFPIFSLTHGPDINLSTLAGKYLVSGDYKSATDCLHSDVMTTAAEELVKFIDDPVLKDWFLWESGQHTVSYPAFTGLSPIIQTRGQLMGSLLSFPILCLANFLTIGVAIQRYRKIPLLDILKSKNPRCLINGDDIIFPIDHRPARDRVYILWKKNAKSIGLSLSVGKTYCSNRFGLINSQMILFRSVQPHSFLRRMGSGPFKVVKTVDQFSVKGVVRTALTQLLNGKMKSLYTTNHRLDFTLACKLIPKSLIVEFNHETLAQTPESIDLPTNFGGIGTLDPNRRISLLDKEVYLFKLLRHSTKEVQILDSEVVVRVPDVVLRGKYRNLFPTSSPPVAIPEIDAADDEFVFPWKDFKKFLKWYKKVPRLRERCYNMSLLNQIPLNLVKLVEVKIGKEVWNELKHFHNLLY